MPQDELLRVQEGMGVKEESPSECERRETHRIHVVAPESILHCTSVTGDCTPTTIPKKNSKENFLSKLMKKEKFQPPLPGGRPCQKVSYVRKGFLRVVGVVVHKPPIPPQKKGPF